MLKIKKISTKISTIPLKAPFKTALRVVDAQIGVQVHIETDCGIIGLGEAPPTAAITGETKESITAAIEGYIAPKIVGRHISDFEDLMESVQHAILRNTSAKAAVDMALYDIRARSLNMPLFRMLGGSAKKLESDLTISLNDTPKMIADSIKAIQSGFKALKIKVGKGGLLDAECLLHIRQAVGADIELRVDANQGWKPKESVRIIRAMEDSGCNISLVEQPVSSFDLNGLRYVTQHVATPVLADEAVFSPHDAIEIIRTGAADMLNIKLMKTGGIHMALKICSIADTYQVSCMMGCMLESRLSTSAAAHLAASRQIITKVDLDGPTLCAADPYIGGPEYVGANIILTDEAGLGVVVKEG